ncbi:MAG: DUF1553 domain-containing protein [Deltaproteobacteria bacterium]|nr:DUF1553 domain-containing protein [Deltaproteobacteria bacterium]
MSVGPSWSEPEPASSRAWLRYGIVLATLAACASGPREVRAGVDFATEIRPILQQRCYECHGPHERKGDLRLTNKADGFTAGNLGIPVITPGSARLSPLVDLVTSVDPDERMPKDREPLSAGEIDLIQRWIDEGASWPEGADEPHWAYTKPRRPPLPQVRRTDWPRRGLDHFVLARLEREGLGPAPVADPATLLRRVHLDLTGLPPSLEEQEEFLRDPSPDAYDRVVDGLLASGRFGERWASEWLDLAHYADSTGFMSEVALSNWPYRDWVIDAIDSDMPFDRFTVEQLAGDLLPDATVEQQVATGFLRSVPLNLEAGVREEDARVMQVVDRGNTMGTTWLGTTVACAQCHDHKYDPLSQVEYYRLLAFFDGTTREAVSFDGAGGVHLVARGPTLDLPPSARDRARAENLASKLLQQIDERLPEAWPGAPPLSAAERTVVLAGARTSGAREAVARAGSIFAERLRKELGPLWWNTWFDAQVARVRAGAPEWTALEIVSLESRVNDTVVEQPYRVLDDGSLLLEGPPPERGTYVLELRDVPRDASGLRVEILTDPSLPGGGPGRGVGLARRPVVVSEIALGELAPDGERPIELATALASAHNAVLPPTAVIDEDPATGWTYGGDALRAAQWITVVPQGGLGLAGERRVRLEIQQLAGEGQMIGRLRVSSTRAERDLVQLPPGLAERFLERGWDGLSGFDRMIVLALARQALVPGLRSSFDRAARAALALARPPRAHVIREEAEPRTTHVFERGDHRTPGIAVSGGTPGMLSPMRPDLPRNRLGLARWLVDRDNPLTARVVVNRWWAQLVGRGIVTTPDDFGVRGDRPSHPDLLDWLAVAFMDSGWSRKAVIREIVTSATYRQGALPASLETLERDPANRLLARNPARRLPAESIRDNALQIAGLLSPKRGGPAVFPPQPPGVWLSNGHTIARYTPSDGEDSYRRGVYAVWRRTTPYPSFVNFDAGDRTACVATRSASNTPLQALTLLNDGVYVEAALAFADRVLRELPSGSSQARVARAFRIALAREPTAGETEVLTRLLMARLASARSDPAEAAAVLDGVARFTASPRVDRSELVAWFHVTRVILNLDETIHRG